MGFIQHGLLFRFCHGGISVHGRWVHGKGALALATARQGTCFIPILYPLAWVFGAYGIATVQAVADILTIVLAIPIIRMMKRKIAQAEQEALPV